MANIFLRHRTWWIKFHHPVTGARIRESLETHDPACAELLRQRIQLEVALSAPCFRAADIPATLRNEINSWNNRSISSPCPNPAVPEQLCLTPPSLPADATQLATRAERVRLDDALISYLDLIRSENVPRHVQNKLSMLRRFLGTERVENFIQSENPKMPARRLARSSLAFFTGQFVDQITPALLQQFFQQLTVSTKTKRHRRCNSRGYFPTTGEITH